MVLLCLLFVSWGVLPLVVAGTDGAKQKTNNAALVSKTLPAYKDEDVKSLLQPFCSVVAEGIYNISTGRL